MVATLVIWHDAVIVCFCHWPWAVIMGLDEGEKVRLEERPGHKDLINK